MFQVRQDDFDKLANFMMDEYGINLTKKKHLVESRLGSVLDSGRFATFTDYVNYITGRTASKDDLRVLTNKLTTNHTYFMRETSHFDFFRDTILPDIEERNKDKRSLSIWSAGCSSGQEPYTLSMIMFDYFGSRRKDWNLKLLATDISNRVLSVAQKATYSVEEVKDVPPEWRQKYMTTNGSKCTFIPEIRNNVVFREFNLMDNISFKTTFDVIFCRNVMIYFEGPTKEAIVNRFYNATNSGGYLLIGQSETINKDSTKYEYLSPAIYKKEHI